MSNSNNLKSGVYLSVKLAAVSERLTFGEGLRVQPPGAEGMPTGTLSAKKELSIGALAGAYPL